MRLITRYASICNIEVVLFRYLVLDEIHKFTHFRSLACRLMRRPPDNLKTCSSAGQGFENNFTSAFQYFNFILQNSLVVLVICNTQTWSASSLCQERDDSGQLSVNMLNNMCTYFTLHGDLINTHLISSSPPSLSDLYPQLIVVVFPLVLNRLP